MRKAILSLLFVFLIGFSYSQQFPNIASVKLESKEDFTPEADSLALKVANYLLATPVDKDNMERLLATQYLLKWMEGTPEFTFSLGGEASKISKKDTDLLGLYLAAMSKYALEHKAESKNDKVVTLNAIKILLDYAHKPENNVKIKGELKKMDEANAKGELEKYLKM